MLARHIVKIGNGRTMHKPKSLAALRADGALPELVSAPQAMTRIFGVRQYKDKAPPVTSGRAGFTNC